MSEQRRATSENDPQEGNTGTRRGPRVLVIDDDDVGRTLISEVLLDSCSRVIELSSPIGATQTAVAEQVDVVVLDVEMPNLRGDMLAKLFRKNPRLGHLGVILVSGCRSEELVRLGNSCDADAVLSKRDVRSQLRFVVHHAWMLARNRSRDAQRAEGAPASDGVSDLRAGARGRTK
jgi:CheY-like chemotaxis protein